MNVDEAMEAAKAYRAAHEKDQEPLFYSEGMAVTLAKEVERLRAELAAAKAASVVPVEEVQKAFDKWLEYECWECHRSICEATWKAAIKWMKERGEG